MVYVIFESEEEKKRFGDCCCCFGDCCKPTILVANTKLKTALDEHSSQG